MAEPATNAAIACPQACASKLPDDQLASWLQHASDFRNRQRRVRHEAEHRDRQDIVKFAISKRQRLGFPLDEPELDIFVLCSPPRGGDHRRIWINASHGGASLGEF